MNEKFNKNAKVKQLTKVVLSHGEEKGLIVIDPFVNTEEAQLNCFETFWKMSKVTRRKYIEMSYNLISQQMHTIYVNKIGRRH